MLTQKLPIDPCHRCNDENRKKQEKCAPVFDWDNDNKCLVPACLVVEYQGTFRKHDLVVRDDFDDRNHPKWSREDLFRRDVTIDPDEYAKKKWVTVLEGKKFVAVWDDQNRLIPRTAVIKNRKIRFQDPLR